MCVHPQQHGTCSLYGQNLCNGSARGGRWDGGGGGGGGWGGGGVGWGGGGVWGGRWRRVYGCVNEVMEDETVTRWGGGEVVGGGGGGGVRCGGCKGGFRVCVGFVWVSDEE
ncbi:unnamed protein product [Dicrocoelium dendriticum]|nr:unnamed protein product [Dicrocoelium dendriticum]